MFLKDGGVFTTTRDVAAVFGKRHDVVMRAANDLIRAEPGIAHNFASIEITSKIGFGFRKDPGFEMTRDGFTLLGMGFTGAKALSFDRSASVRVSVADNVSAQETSRTAVSVRG